jgi:hypothetical protein
MVEYAYRQLRRQLGVAADRKELSWIVDVPLREFFTGLAQPGFQRTVPDQEVEAMRQALGEDVDAARQRLGIVSRMASNNTLVEWRDIDRNRNSFADPKTRRFDLVSAYLPDKLRTNAEAALASPDGKPLLSSTWHGMMRGRLYRLLPPRTLAEYYHSAVPQLQREYFAGELSTVDMENLLQFGFVLVGGGFYEEAEEIFRRVAEVPDNDLTAIHKARELRANARLNLGALAIHFGRDNEGAGFLRQAIEMSGESMVRVVENRGPQVRYGETVQSVAQRLLSDLREQIPDKEILHSVGQIRVDAPGYFPGKVSYFFRVPAGFDPASGRTYRVLLVVPSINQDAAEYCKFGHAWARFADANDLFLIVPRFMPFWSDSTMPQEWSGEATRKALEEMGQRYPIATDRLLLHGFGRGAAFLQRFALWRPQLCAAASLHSSYDWAWEESLPEGFCPLSDLRHLPMLVTCGERDGGIDHALRGSYAATVRFVTFARGEGLPVTWKSFPDLEHRPSAELENLAQKFLAEQLVEKPTQVSTP